MKKIICLTLFFILLFSGSLMAQIENLYKGEFYPESIPYNGQLLFKRDSSYYNTFDFYGIHDYSHSKTDTVWAISYNDEVDSSNISFLYLKQDYWKAQSEMIQLEYFFNWKMNLVEFNLLVDSLYKITYDTTIYNNCKVLCHLLLVANTLDEVHVKHVLENEVEPKLYVDFRNRIAEIINKFTENKNCKSSGVRTTNHVFPFVNYYNEKYKLNMEKEVFFKILWNENDVRYKAVINNRACFAIQTEEINEIGFPVERITAFYWFGDIIKITE